MNLIQKQFIERIDDEIERIQHIQDNLNFMTDQQRTENLKAVLIQYTELLKGNKAMITKMRG